MKIIVYDSDIAVKGSLSVTMNFMDGYERMVEPQELSQESFFEHSPLQAATYDAKNITKFTSNHDSELPQNPHSILHELEDALYGGNKKSRGINMAVTMVCDIGWGVGGFYLAKHYGISNVHAYMIAAIGPLVSLLINLYRSKTVSVFSLGMIGFQILGIVLTFIVGKHEKWLLYKDGLVSLIIAVIVLASVWFFRPVFFYIFQRFNSDGTQEGVRAWDKLWEYEHIQRAMRNITLLWGIILLVEGIFKLVTTHKLQFSVSFMINSITPMIILFVGVLITGSIFQRAMNESKRLDIERGIVFPDDN